MAKAADTILERIRHQRSLAGWLHRADRVTGMVSGFTTPSWASHSMAMASAIARVGTTSGVLAGVRTGRPSSRTAKPPSTWA